MSLTSSYSDEDIGAPFEYFRNAYLSGQDRDYKLIIDVEYDQAHFFLPELYKLKIDSKKECPMELCRI